MKETTTMAKKRSRTQQRPQENAATDILETMKAELGEGVELLQRRRRPARRSCRSLQRQTDDRRLFEIEAEASRLR
jgi:hypothetical protein